jgi:hypothetical protein
MDDEFYSGNDTEKRLVAVAFRAADSILRSIKWMPAAIGDEVLALFTLDSLWGLCLIGAGWFLTSVISGPIGAAINLSLLAYGVYSSWGTIEQTYEQFKDWFWGFYSAHSEAELEKAGEHFAKGFIKGGAFLLQLFLTHKALKFASAKLVKRFPPPKKLRMRFEEELRKAKEKEQSEGQQRSEGTESERQRRSAVPEEEPTSRERKALRKLQELRKTMEATGGFELGRDAAKKLPDAGSVGGAALVGAAAVVGVLAIVAAAASEDDNRRRRS